MSIDVKTNIPFKSYVLDMILGLSFFIGLFVILKNFGIWIKSWSENWLVFMFYILFTLLALKIFIRGYKDWMSYEKSQKVYFELLNENLKLQNDKLNIEIQKLKKLK